MYEIKQHVTNYSKCLRSNSMSQTTVIQQMYEIKQHVTNYSKCIRSSRVSQITANIYEIKQCVTNYSKCMRSKTTKSLYLLKLYGLSICGTSCKVRTACTHKLSHSYYSSAVYNVHFSFLKQTVLKYNC